MSLRAKTITPIESTSPRLEYPCMATVTMTTHTSMRSAAGYIIAKKVSLRLPSKCGSTCFNTSAEPSVLRPNPKIEESTSSIRESFRCAASRRGRPIIAKG